MQDQLLSPLPLTTLAHSKGIETWDTLLSYISALPYGRNSSRTDFSTVLREGKGTCSSKHALVKAIAIENTLDTVKLILCLYRMTPENTPGIGSSIEQTGLDYIPEAHCYLSIQGQSIDLTTPHSSLSRIESAIIQELEILPDQVGSFKVDYHKDYIRQWILDEGLALSFEEVWEVREACIEALSEKS